MTIKSKSRMNVWTMAIAIILVAEANLSHAVTFSTNITRRVRLRDNGRTTVEINNGSQVGDAGNDADNRLLMYFDVSSLSGLNATDATLSVQVGNTSGAPGIDDFFDLYVVDDNNVGWITSNDPTWNNLSQAGPTIKWMNSAGTDLPSGAGNPASPGTNDGGLGAPGDGYSNFQDTVNQAAYANGSTISWTVSAAVMQDMIDGTNAGFLIRGRDQTNTGRLNLTGGTAVLSFQIVPEPTTAALGLLGMTGLLMRRRRSA